MFTLGSVRVLSDLSIRSNLAARFTDQELSDHESAFSYLLSKADMEVNTMKLMEIVTDAMFMWGGVGQVITTGEIHNMIDCVVESDSAVAIFVKSFFVQAAREWQKRKAS